MLTWSRRGVGLLVLLLSSLPLHRLLSPERTGPWGAQAVDQADLSWNLTTWGTVVVLLLSVVGGIFARGRARAGPDARGALRRFGGRVRERIDAPGSRTYSLVIGCVAGALATAVAIGVFRRLLTNVDEMTALIHARYLAAGSLAGPVSESAEAWLVPNMLVVDSGWVSQYPPGHLGVLAVFSALGVWWLCGPMMFGAMAGFSSASFERLLPRKRRTEARVAALILALSPFSLLLGGGALSHLTAGAALATALYCALRAASGHWSWALWAGASVGLAVLARPWTGILLGPLLTLGVWTMRGGVWTTLRAIGPWVAGGIPFAVLLFAYNDAMFGGPLTLGYEVLYGPAHRLGLHPDPWSFPYGMVEALGYTASDVIQFGARLLETPISVGIVVGAYLLVAPRLSAGAGIAAAWAVVPVLGNAVYWFHQPRMLFEAAPAWILLFVLAISALYRKAGPATRSGVIWATSAAVLVAVASFAPARFRGHAWSAETLSRTTLTDPAANGALVFVHTSWNERNAALLQASGMRNDSIQAVMRRNDTCALFEYGLARVRGPVGGELPPIDLVQSSTRPASLGAVEGPGGNILGQRVDAAWSPDCIREAEADRFGSIALAPLLWQGDLPGIESGGPLFVRDFGPARNSSVLARFADREPQVFMYRPDGSGPGLLAYDDAMDVLWGRAPGDI